MNVYLQFLIRSFDVELNGGELDATMRVFDLNGDGAISYGEFMTTFYQLGLEERSRRLLAQKTRDKNVNNANKEKIQKRNNAFDEELRSHIVWPVLPDESLGTTYICMNIYIYIRTYTYMYIYVFICICIYT
jgi:hypothetical protein